MISINAEVRYHTLTDLHLLGSTGKDLMAYMPEQVNRFNYEFQNFFHPYVGELIAKLNRTSIAGMLDPAFLATCRAQYTAADYALRQSLTQQVTLEDRGIDVGVGQPYANYNWELLYHIPVMIAVHLSNNQRFAEAQDWFHLVFDPRSTDTSVPAPQRYWKSYVFRGAGQVQDISSQLRLLSTPDSQLSQAERQAKANLITGYNAILANPFRPHVVARTRQSAYQWYVVMKYLDNLIAWGDSLFLMDTIETFNEASLCYVLASGILGPRPPVMPAPGKTPARNFRQLKQAGLDRMSNALVTLESQFPFNLVAAPGSSSGGGGNSGSTLLGMARSLYFCIPPNPHLLAYWDVVSDRLFKIRNSENFEGSPQLLPLFDPPLDPGMLVKAAAAGIDIASIVSGLSQPRSLIRTPMLIQKALEIVGEVRTLGNSLLAALEKGDAEGLARLRQEHEVDLQTRMRNIRFLQLQHAQETTTGLLRTRASALERYTYYLRMLGQTPDPTTVPPDLALNRTELTEDNFDDVFGSLVSQYDLAVPQPNYPTLKLAQSTSVANQAGASGPGALYLNTYEDSELNTLLPTARDTRLTASAINAVAPIAQVIPDFYADLHYFGLGTHAKVFGGSTLAAILRTIADGFQMSSAYLQDQAGIASRTGSHLRRADEWTFQANLAARELKSIGRQIIGSLIAEQVAHHDYETVKSQAQHAQDVLDVLTDKFTNTELYTWMQSQITGFYYQYYRFACDTARKAEKTLKQELMRPELDDTQFVGFDYWDSGHQGLLAGEQLFLAVKRMEMAYHDCNQRECELTRNVSLRQLDAMALLTLRITGSCTVTIPEWFYDCGGSGEYMRRIKSVALSLPAVVGPNTPLNCTVSLQSSTLRTSPLLSNGAYSRDDSGEDGRFLDFFGATQTIVTSTGTNDSGLFETNLRDERFLPFEGAGAISRWTLALPSDLRLFDYSTIADVILHIRYTARLAGDPLKSQATKELRASLATQGEAVQALLFCLRYDFPSEWAAFVNGDANFAVTLAKRHFPYMAQTATNITVDSIALYAANGVKVASVTPNVNLADLSIALNGAGTAALSLAADSAVLIPVQTQQVYLVIQYHFS
jgi:Tc toxin complex TcA C-terminal TcB-binding domain